MAVKFSQFTPETVAANVTEIVGYTATGDLNVRIPPANLDTLVTSDTAQVGTSATYTLSGTKTGTSTTTDLTTYTVPANSGMALTAGTNTIAFDATSYSLASTDSVVGNNSVPVNLTGTGGGDSGVDTVTIVGTGTVQVSSATNTITIDGGSTGDVTSFTNSNGGSFVAYGTVNTAATGPVTIGDVDLTASGTASATTFLRGDNQWATPPSGSGTVTSVGTTTTGIAALTLSGTVTTSGDLDLAKTGGTGGQYIDGAAGAWTTLPAGDTYTLQAGAKAGTSVPLQLDAAAGADSTVSLTEGTGITLTQTSATEITIASAAGVTMTTSPAATGDGATATYPLGVTPTDENFTMAYISGVYQLKSSYSVTGSNITFDTNVPNGASIEVVTTT